MARLSKRKRHCQAATVASQIARRRREEKRREKYKVPEPEPEPEPEFELDQELVMAEDAFVRLKTAMMEEPVIKYARSCQMSRQTIWRDKRKQQELREAATGSAVITQYFNKVSESETVEEPVTNRTVVEPVPSISDVRTTAIHELKKLLRSSKSAPTGQNLMRHMAVLYFLQLQLKRPWETREALSLVVSESFGKRTETARRIRAWEKSWISVGTIKIGLRGISASAFSWLDDEGVLLAVREYIATVGEKLTSHGLAQAVTQYLQSDMIGCDEVETTLRDEHSIAWKRSISERTARNWLNKLGFAWKDVRKGVYIDGHERDDVVRYRQDMFLPSVQQLFDRGLREWDEDGNIITQVDDIPVGEKEKILVTHDESTFNANDGKRQMWILNDAQPLRQKSRGRGIMVSEFLTPRGRLCVPEHISAEGLLRRQATEYLEYGQDNYWSADKMVKHTLEVAIPIFERAYPGKQAVFFFDNASSHNAYASDALLVSAMNLGPGGKQPVMRKGFIHSKQRPQSMVFEHNHPDVNLRGKPKGIRQILIERDLWRPGMKLDCKPRCQDTTSRSCCARQCLRMEQDFQHQKGSLQEGIEAHGHQVLFYPKFHCELNFIEFFWAASKRYARENCEYSLQGLRDTIPQALASVSDTTIWRFYQKCQRTMQAYRNGCQYGTEAFKDHVYKSHRRKLA